MTAEPYTLSNSEIQTFKRCRRKWYLSYYRKLKPINEPVLGPLALGSRVHKALEGFYGAGSDLLEVHAELIEADRMLLMSQGYDVADLDSEAELGRIMLEGYVDWVAQEGLDANLKVVSSEEILSTPMMDGRVLLQGKLDLRVQSTHDGAHSALDFKHQPIDEPVLTPKGWRAMGDIQAGDWVIGSRWTPIRVLDAFPMSEQVIYKVLAGPSVYAYGSSSHTWPTMDGRAVTSAQIAEQRHRGDEKDALRRRLVWPHVGEPNQEHEENAYTLGWWLADGPVRPDDAEDDSILATAGLSLLHSNERYIPAEWIASFTFRERVRLFQGIADVLAVRAVDPRYPDVPQFTLNAPNMRFADDLRLLITSIGGEHSDATTRTSKPHTLLVLFLPVPPVRRHILRQTFPTGIAVSPLFTPEHARAVRQYDSPARIGVRLARCIRVDATDGLYVTRSGMLTHNTSANFADYSTMSHMEEQGLTYLTLDRIATDAEWRIDGFILRLLRKVKRTAKAKPPFYEQITVRHNVFTLRNFWLRLNGVLRDILSVKDQLDSGVDPMLVAYPTPTRNCKFDCNFIKICPLFDDGGGAEDAITDLFEEADPYSYYHK